MYREAYARGNDSTINLLMRLDEEKMKVLKSLGFFKTSVFEAGGFNMSAPIESLHRYSESSDRAISQHLFTHVTSQKTFQRDWY